MLKTVITRAAFVAAICWLSIPGYALADGVKRAVKIPSGDLAAALQLLVKQSGAELVYRPEQVRGVTTRGVDGEYSTEEAVTRLLEGTALTVSTDATGAMLIAAPLLPGKQTTESAPPAANAGSESEV